MAPRANRAALLVPVPFLLLLIWLATRSTVAAVMVLPAAPTLDRVVARTPVPANEIEAAAQRYEAAAIWLGSGANRLAAARILAALPAAERTRVLPKMAALTEASLTAAPMSSYGWTLLAYLRAQQNQPTAAARAWTLSTQIGRYVPDLMEARLVLGFDLLRRAPELQSAVVDQINLLADVDPRALAHAARQAGAEPLVRGVLHGGPASAPFERETATLVAAAIADIRARQLSLGRR